MKKLLIFLIGFAGIFPIVLFLLRLSAGEDVKPERRDKPVRIVSLCLPVTEIICQLGLEDKIVGICSGECPEQVKDKPKIGKAFGAINLESVIALKPDLVFCWGDGIVFREKGLSVYSLYTKDLDGVIKLVEEVADLLGEKQRAVPILTAMKEKVGNIEKKLSFVKENPLVYFEAGSIGKTRGPGSLTNELIAKAGGVNLAGENNIPFPLLSNEFIIAGNPDIILVEDYGKAIEKIRSRNGWKEIKAVKNNKIFRCPSYYTNYSPKCIKGLEQFAAWFHPELFKQ